MNPVSGAVLHRQSASPEGGGGPIAMPPGVGSFVPRPHFVDRRGNAPLYVPSQDLTQLITALPLHARATFTSEQLAALDVAVARTRPRRNRHGFDYRVSLPLLGRRYYFVFLAGRERRSLSRIRGDGENTTWRLSMAYAMMMSAIAMGGLVVAVLLLYVVKSMAGIDLFDEHSFLHGLFY